MRAAVEKQLNLIAQGKANFSAVLRHGIDIFERKFMYFVKTIMNMDELFEVSFTKLSESGRPLSRCGKCFRYMKYIEAKPYRLFCSTCDETYSLPQNGCVKVYKVSVIINCVFVSFFIYIMDLHTSNEGSLIRLSWMLQLGISKIKILRLSVVLVSLLPLELIKGIFLLLFYLNT